MMARDGDRRVEGGAVRGRKINWIYVGIAGLVVAVLVFWGVMMAVTSEKRNADMIVYYSDAEEDVVYIQDARMAELIEETDFDKLRYKGYDDCGGSSYLGGGRNVRNVVVEFPKKDVYDFYMPCQVELPEEMLRFLRGKGFDV